MFTFCKTLKYFAEVYKRKEISGIYKLLNIYVIRKEKVVTSLQYIHTLKKPDWECNSWQYGKTVKDSHHVYTSVMAREKNSRSKRGKNPVAKKTISKDKSKSKKKSFRSRSRSRTKKKPSSKSKQAKKLSLKKYKKIIPTILIESSTSSNNSEDLNIVFDLKEDRRKVAEAHVIVISDDSNSESLDKGMGNVKSEPVDQCVTNSMVQNAGQTSFNTCVGQSSPYSVQQELSARQTSSFTAPSLTNSGLQSDISAWRQDRSCGQTSNTNSFCSASTRHGRNENFYTDAQCRNSDFVIRNQQEMQVFTQEPLPGVYGLSQQCADPSEAMRQWDYTNFNEELQEYPEPPEAVRQCDYTSLDKQSKDSPKSPGAQLKDFRQWEYTDFGKRLKGSGKMKSSAHHVLFTLLSYNVLAQDLLQSHPYLYHKHQPQALKWEHRSSLLVKELKKFNADILCLQEVQASHVNTFYNKLLLNIGYNGIYKQRTGGNMDGVAIYFKSELFELVDYTTVEYFQPGVSVLDRHNVGLVAKLAVKNNPKQQIVVATTHLLFNPRRHDVKLAQMQLLLAEVERFAFRNFSNGSATYWPVIITGDMNFEPYTGVFKLLTKGVFRYEGLSSKSLEQENNGQLLDRYFLPKELGILDTCQHWGILNKRLIEQLDHKSELKYIRIHNNDNKETMRRMHMMHAQSHSFEAYVNNAREEGYLNNFVPFFGSSPVPPMPVGGYATGQLTHNLNLQSVYTYSEDNRRKTVTTNQNNWVTVDYIFYSSNKMYGPEDELRLVSRYRLLTPDQANQFGPIPNFISPSDHYPLMATFYLKS